MNIKPYIITLILSSSGVCQAFHPSMIERGNAILDNCEREPLTENLVDAGDFVQGIATHLDRSKSDDVAVFRRFQNRLISIPGHSKCYVDLLESERSRVKDRAGENSYDRNRSWYLSTVSQLPSPETVKVLGEYLPDERDYEEMVAPPGTACPTRGRESNAGMAASAFTGLGLRNPPVERFDFQNYANKDLWRQWYAKVSAGEIAFSFLGKKEEHRFKPDGTWETVSLPGAPDDGYKLLERPEPAPVIYEPNGKEASPAPAPGPAAKNVTLWIVAGLLLLLAPFLAYRLKQRSS